jgi:hypothetical protein
VGTEVEKSSKTGQSDINVSRDIRSAQKASEMM